MKFSSINHILRNAALWAGSGFVALTLASCGGGGGSPGTVQGTAGAVSVGTLSLIFSNTELKSAGAAGSEVTITAVAKSTDNSALEKIPVKFAVDSGLLTAVDSATDKNGLAKATLGTGGDYTNRTITVTATGGGKTATGTVNVTGTSITQAGPTAITSGSTGDFTITVKDSAGVPIPKATVTFTSQRGNPFTVKSSGGGTSSAPQTNSQGQVILTLTASQLGTDTITVSALGTSTVQSISVSGTQFKVSTVDTSGNAVSQAATAASCTRINARYENNGVPQNGNVNISTSRGNIYSDSNCTSLLNTSSSVAVTAGNAQPTYIKSDSAGVATITASIQNGPTAQSTLEFVAPLTSAATISLQASPAVIGTNSNGSQTEQSTLTAVVRDGTAQNNLVKNAVVQFSIVNDPSGGALSNPTEVTTGSDGAASVAFIAGPSDTATNGVKVQARIRDINKTVTTDLTVSRKSLFVNVGTGNIIKTPSDTLYQKDYSVFVTDASGNAVSGVDVTAQIIPTNYWKGRYYFDDVNLKAWDPYKAVKCSNEDTNKNGTLDAGEDFNNNQLLDPGIPLTVTSSGKTDATGTATVTVTYPRDRANWTEVNLTVRGVASGTESTGRAIFTLPVLGSDLTDKNVSPPGHISPYGEANNCSDKN